MGYVSSIALMPCTLMLWAIASTVKHQGNKPLEIWDPIHFGGVFFIVNQYTRNLRTAHNPEFMLFSNVDNKLGPASATD